MAQQDEITWDLQADTDEKAISFSHMQPGIYTVRPQRIVDTPYGSKLMLEIEDDQNVIFKAFSPANYRARLQRLCKSYLATHMLNYKGIVDIAQPNGKMFKKYDYMLGCVKPVDVEPTVEPQTFIGAN